MGYLTNTVVVVCSLGEMRGACWLILLLARALLPVALARASSV